MLIRCIPCGDSVLLVPPAQRSNRLAGSRLGTSVNPEVRGTSSSSGSFPGGCPAARFNRSQKAHSLRPHFAGCRVQFTKRAPGKASDFSSDTRVRHCGAPGGRLVVPEAAAWTFSRSQSSLSTPGSIEKLSRRPTAPLRDPCLCKLYIQ